MYGSLLSVLLLGVLPIWGGNASVADYSALLSVAAPSIISPEDLAPLNTVLTASGAVILDIDSGQTLYTRGENTPRPMASLTKLMTALLIVEHHSLDEIVTIPSAAAEVSGTRAYLTSGHRFTVGDLLSAMLIPSANDAAYALAVFHAGSMKSFTEKMNERAKELGLQDTSYTNAIGLDASAQQSSPRDLALLAMTVLRHDAIRERMSRKVESIVSLEGNTISLVHSHQLLQVSLAASVTGSGSNSAAAIVSAGKTGTTDAAGQCLLSLFQAGGRQYVAVLLNSRDRYADMRAILQSFSQ